jgi:UDPglucose--hexose-1-phosphate uridylyltransferase
MAEIRYNPLIKDWVMIASHRQNRPQMPKDWCPFCPGSGKVPDDFDVLKYDNDFPALSQNPVALDPVTTDFFQAMESYGKCEVILYSKEHTVTLPELPVSHIEKIVDLWTERFEELSKDEKIKYIFIFENRGDVVGVTMPHPHGQIYGYPFLPKKLALEMDSCREHYQEKHTCLLCDLIKNEVDFKQRVIMENEDFIAILPFFSEYPYGVYIFSKQHKQNLTQFTKSEKTNLAKILKDVTGTLDSLFDYAFPYMMCLYQNPINGEDVSDFYHFHIAFYPPMRSKDKQKFNASSETGAWAHCNPTAPEEKAQELREAYERFLSKQK